MRVEFSGLDIFGPDVISPVDDGKGRIGYGLDQAYEQDGGVQEFATNEQQRSLLGVYVRSFIISSFERPCRRSVLGILSRFTRFSFWSPSV